MARLLVATDSPDEQQLMDELRAEYRVTASPNGSCATSNRSVPEGVDDPVSKIDEPPAYEVLVRLLGNITVEGGKVLKPKATSVVDYLALHRPVSTDPREEASWFGSDGDRKSTRLNSSH